jgi:uncharacterized membrane protein YphA (DoxX/SURF4 family)
VLRRVARPLLAGLFVVMGAQAVKNPQPLVDGAEPVADALQPLLHRLAPENVAGHIPDDPATLVRLNGAVQVIGGLLLATGNGRRIGAGLLALSIIPTTIARHAFWQIKDDRPARQEQFGHFLKNASLFGALVLAAQDTEGQPSIAWRTQHGLEAAKKSGARSLRTAKREARMVSKLGRSELPF